MQYVCCEKKEGASCCSHFHTKLCLLVSDVASTQHIKQAKTCADEIC